MLLGAALVPGAAFAAGDAGDVAAGRTVALEGVVAEHASCAACHLADGAGQPEVGIPRLAGMDADYLDRQLGWFADGSRDNAVMHGFASALPARQRRDVAAYFASLKVPEPVDPEPAPASSLALGRQLVTHGEPPGLLACATCHMPNERGMGAFAPSIAGQSADYLAEQLATWHDGSMRDPGGAPMRQEARSLTRAETRAIADWLAQLPGGAP